MLAAGAVLVLLPCAPKMNGVLLCWLAYIFTRLFGAPCGGFLTNQIATVI